MNIANLKMGRVLIDSGSFTDIITMDCLSKLKYRETDLTHINEPLVGFRGQSVHPLGSVKISTRIGENGKEGTWSSTS